MKHAMKYFRQGSRKRAALLLAAAMVITCFAGPVSAASATELPVQFATSTAGDFANIGSANFDESRYEGVAMIGGSETRTETFVRGVGNTMLDRSGGYGGISKTDQARDKALIEALHLNGYRSWVDSGFSQYLEKSAYESGNTNGAMPRFLQSNAEDLVIAGVQDGVLKNGVGGTSVRDQDLTFLGNEFCFLAEESQGAWHFGGYDSESLAAYAAWLQQKFGTVANMNSLCGTRFTTFAAARPSYNTGRLFVEFFLLNRKSFYDTAKAAVTYARSVDPSIKWGYAAYCAYTCAFGNDVNLDFLDYNTSNLYKQSWWDTYNYPSAAFAYQLDNLAAVSDRPTLLTESGFRNGDANGYNETIAQKAARSYKQMLPQVYMRVRSGGIYVFTLMTSYDEGNAEYTWGLINAKTREATPSYDAVKQAYTDFAMLDEYWNGASSTPLVALTNQFIDRRMSCSDSTSSNIAQVLYTNGISTRALLLDDAEDVENLDTDKIILNDRYLYQNPDGSNDVCEALYDFMDNGSRIASFRDVTPEPLYGQGYDLDGYEYYDSNNYDLDTIWASAAPFVHGDFVSGNVPAAENTVNESAVRVLEVKDNAGTNTWNIESQVVYKNGHVYMALINNGNTAIDNVTVTLGVNQNVKFNLHPAVLCADGNVTVATPARVAAPSWVEDPADSAVTFGAFTVSHLDTYAFVDVGMAVVDFGVADTVAPTVSLSASVARSGDVADLSWTMEDDKDLTSSLTAAVYMAPAAFTAADITAYEGGDHSRLTLVAADCGMTATRVTGLAAGNTRYVAVKVTDRAGNAAVAFTSFTVSADLLLYDFENVKASDVLVQNAIDGDIVSYGGSKAARFYYSGANSYPFLGVKGQLGDFCGSGFSVNWQATTGTQIGQFIYLYKNAAGNTAQYAQNYYAVPENGTLTIGYPAELTAEMRNNLYEIRFLLNEVAPAPSRYIYLDDFTVKNAYTALTLAAEAKGSGCEANLTWRLTDAAAAAESTFTLYASKMAITAQDITAFEEGQDNGLKLVGTACGNGSMTAAGLLRNTDYYFAVRGVDRSGTASYAFTSTRTPNAYVRCDYENISREKLSAYTSQENLGPQLITVHNGSKMLTSHFNCGNNYPNIWVRGKAGDFNGTGLSFYYDSDRNVQVHKFSFLYLDEDGEEQVKEARTYFDLVPNAYNTFSYAEAGLTAKEIASVVGFHFYMYYADTTPLYFYIDDVAVVNPIDTEAPEASLTATVMPAAGTVRLSWTKSDACADAAAMATKLYVSQSPITENKLRTGDSSLTLLTDDPEASVYTLTGATPNQKLYFGLCVTDLAGHTTYVIQNAVPGDARNVALANDYESETNVTAVSAVNALPATALVQHQGSRMLQFTSSTDHNWPSLILLTEPGDLCGDGFGFYWDTTVDTNFSGMVLYYEGDDGNDVAVPYDNFYTIPTAGTYQYFAYPASLTQEQIARLYKIQIVLGINGSTPAERPVRQMYVDDLMAINPFDGKAPEAAIVVTGTAGNAVAEGSATDNVSAASAITNTVYMSDTAITEERIEAFEGGAANGLVRLNSGFGTVRGSTGALDGSTTYYFAVRAEDAAGNVGYAFTSFTTEAKTVVLYNFDEREAADGTITATDAAISVKTLASQSARGGMLSVKPAAKANSTVSVSGNAGDFGGSGISFKAVSTVTQTDPLLKAPSLTLGYLRFYYGQTYVQQDLDLVVANAVIADTVHAYTVNYSAAVAAVAAQVTRIEATFLYEDYTNGSVELYLDDLAVISPTMSLAAVQSKLNTSPFVTPAELALALDSGLMEEYLPSVHSNTLCMREGAYKFQLGFNIANPEKLTKTLAANGYYLSDIGVLLLPEALLGGAPLTKKTEQVLNISASLTSGAAGNDGYRYYTAVLSNSTDYEMYPITARAFVTYKNSAGKTLTLYSHNNNSACGVENGTINRSLNRVTRLTAQKYYDGGFYGSVEFAPGENFLNSLSLATVREFVESAYLSGGKNSVTGTGEWNVSGKEPDSPDFSD